MRPITFRGTTTATLAMLLILALASCGGGDEPLTQTEIEAIVKEELAAQEPPAQGPTEAQVMAMIEDSMADEGPGTAGMTAAEVRDIARAELEAAPRTGVTEGDVQKMIASALSSMPEDEGVTMEEAKAAARAVIASVPPRSNPPAYTQYVVDSAISSYQTNGLEATVARYNQPSSVDGQWYVFIIDEDGTVISHYDPDRLGLDLKGWVGTDANGYNFGADMLSATEEGKWVSYVYKNPEAGYTPDVWGQENLKNAWVVRHDGMLFGSGWYIDSEKFTEAGVREAVAVFRQSGLQGTLEHFASGNSTVAGMIETLLYYNNAPEVDGQFHAFIADRDGKLITHPVAGLVGSPLTDIFGPDGIEATKAGGWVEGYHDDGSLAYKAWVIDDAGLTFGSGWFSGLPLE